MLTSQTFPYLSLLVFLLMLSKFLLKAEYRTIIFKAFIFVLPGYALLQPNNQTLINENSTNTNKQALDSFIIKINNEITYGLYVFNDNTYYLKVNGLDSVEIGPFYWEQVNSRGLVFENLQTHHSYSPDEGIYYLCIPYSMEDYMLIKIYKQNGVFEIDKNRSNWISSESGFLVINAGKTIVIPVIRGIETGMFAYWKYDEKLKKYILYQKKYIDQESREGHVYDIKNIKIIKKIIKIM